jgi:uncharacterized membrane protein YccC
VLAAPISSRLRKIFEHSILTIDVARALRSSVAFVGGWIACLWTSHPELAPFVATAAQNVALTDVRGDYRVRLAVLLTMTTVMAAAAVAGTVTGGSLLGATLMTGALALMGGVWRHLSGDYGPNLAVVSALLFLIALSQPGDWHSATGLAAWIALAGAGAILLQISAWFFRPQHHLRHVVAESWVAASDLIAAMRTETDTGERCASEFGEKENTLRATLDRTWNVLGAATGKKSSAFLTHLNTATHIAGRLATRVAAFNTAAEVLRERADFATLAPTLDSVLRSLASAARSAALTIVTHRSEQFVALEVRLQRCAHLTHVLAARLDELPDTDTDVAQVRQMIAQVEELLPVIRSTLAETVDHGTARGGFALRLPELGELNARTLGSWINRAQQLDPLLVRYSLRVAAVTMLAVAAYEWFDVPRGYWIAFTAIVVLQPDYGATRQKAGQRIVGTLAGSVLGTALLWIKMPLPYLLVLTGITAFCFAYFVKRRYGLAVFFVTLMIVLITEAVTPVHWDFTVGRLLSNVAGGVLALVAALFFWPNWEQEQFPKTMGAAVRANRKYLEAIGTRLTTGEPFAGDVIQTKRVVERANSLAAASVQRQLGEPSAQHHHVERAAALMAYNQRVTRALTVLAVHLNKGERRDATEISDLVRRTGDALEHLALAIERDSNTPADLERAAARAALATCLQVGEPSNAQPAADLVPNQFGKVATEIAAMMLALNMTEEKP